MLQHYSRLLHAAWSGWSATFAWLGPACAVLHVVGTALVVGSAIILDLRLLGFATDLPLPATSKLPSWGIVGLVATIVTGIGLYAADPAQYNDNTAFWAKMSILALTTVNAVAFYATGVARRVEAIGADGGAPFGARVCAVISIVLWASVIFWGGMLPYFGSPP
jgi:hypothetical protein